MLKASPLLFIGLIMFFWARSMTHEDYVVLGLAKAGHLEFRTAAGAMSVAALPGLHQLGKGVTFEKISRRIDRANHKHTGFNGRFGGPMDWELRITMLGVMAIVIFGLVILMKRFKNA